MSENEIAFGSISAFDAAAIRGTPSSMTWLSATHFVVVWQKYSNDSGYARVGSISGTTITWGAEAQFQDAGGYEDWWGPVIRPRVRKIDDTHVLIVWKDDGGSWGLIATISDLSISFGTITGLLDVLLTYIDAAILDSTHAVITYVLGGNVKARILTISGTNITSWGTEYTASTDAGYETDVDVLDSTHFVVTWRRTTCESKIGEVTGTAISFGTQAQIYNATGNLMDVAALDSTHFVVFWCDANISYKYGRARAASISGTTITYGSAVEVTAAVTYFPAVAKYDSTTFLMSYERDAETAGACQFGTIAGTAITIVEGVYDYNPSPTGRTNANEIAVLSTELCVVAFRADDLGTGAGYANAGIIGEAPPAGIPRTFAVIF